MRILEFLLIGMLSQIRIWTSNGVKVVVNDISIVKNLQLISAPESLNEDHLILRRSPTSFAVELLWGGLSLKTKQTPFSIDYTGADFVRRRTSVTSELIVRAFGKGDRTDKLVWDLTSGMGRDSYILASAGYKVIMFERNKVLHALVQDGISRLRKTDMSDIASRMILYNLDASIFRGNNSEKFLCDCEDDSVQVPITEVPDVVYLDPMYPASSVGRRSSVKKETQILHHLVGHDEGEDEANNKNLLSTALKSGCKRVVVKRPLNALPLCMMQPDFCLEGTGQRFDVYSNNLRERVIFCILVRFSIDSFYLCIFPYTSSKPRKTY